MALEDILTAIRVVAAGDAMIAPGVTRRLIERTPDIDVAGEAGTTAGTAKTHVAHLLAKLGARDRGQLVITAYQAGLFGT
jgi:DNA-binding NarL/FixJ family response regulator